MLGAGYWGQKLIRAMREVVGVGRMFCVDPRPELRQELERRFGAVHVVDREDDLIDDPRVKAVVIATPASSHYALAKRWIMAGKHVLVEKPIALDVGAARELTTLAEHMGVGLLPGHTYHFNGAEEYLRSFVRSGELGDPLWLQSERANLGRFRQDVSVLWDLGPHDATILVDLLDPEIETCQSTGSPTNRGSLETCCVTMRTDRQVGVAWTLSWRSPEKVRRIALVGTRHTVLWDDLEGAWPLRIYRTEFHQESPSTGHAEVVARVTGVSLPAVDHGEPLLKECQHFVDVVNGFTQPVLGARHILNVTAVLARAEAALRPA